MSYRLFVPVAVFLLLLGFGVYLLRGEVEESALLDKRPFSFAPRDLYDEDLYYDATIFDGHISLVNVFASWCVPCIAEHPFITALAESGELRMVGLNWKDEPTAARAFLSEHGNPYDFTTYDEDGRTAIDWGVSGVPETYIVDSRGIIRYKHVGAILDDSVVDEILVIVEGLR